MAIKIETDPYYIIRDFMRQGGGEWQLLRLLHEKTGKRWTKEDVQKYLNKKRG